MERAELAAEFPNELASAVSTYYRMHDDNELMKAQGLAREELEDACLRARRFALAATDE